MRRREEPLADRALQQLVHTGFLTGPNLAYGRWLLGSAPEGAIILTAGDMDTYPTVVVQATERLRPDVAVVNGTLLNLPWYAERMAAQSHLPLPDSSWHSASGSDGPAIVAHWRYRAARGVLGRALTFEVRVDPSCECAELGGVRLSGPAWRVVSDTGKAVDTAAVASALHRLDRESWAGLALSPADRSPVRRAAAFQPAFVVVWIAETYAEWLSKAGDQNAARSWLDWAWSFAMRSELDPQKVRPTLAAIRASIPSR